MGFVVLGFVSLLLAVNPASVQVPITAVQAAVTALFFLPGAVAALSPVVCLLVYPKLTPVAAVVAFLGSAGTASLIPPWKGAAVWLGIIPLATVILTLPSILKDQSDSDNSVRSS